MDAAKKKRGKKRSPKQKANELAIAKRREKVCELRLAAWSVRDISEQLRSLGFKNCSVGTVQSDLDAVMERTNENANGAMRIERALSVGRLDLALKGIWDKATTGDLEAIDRFVKLDKRRAEVLGSDAPSRHELSGPDGEPIEVNTKNSLERKLDELGRRLAGVSAEPGGTPIA